MYLSASIFFPLDMRADEAEPDSSGPSYFSTTDNKTILMFPPKRVGGRGGLDSQPILRASTTLLKEKLPDKIQVRGALWLSGRVSGLRRARLGIQNLPLPCCVLEQDTLLPEKYW